MLPIGSKCTGCSACYSACATGAINMIRNGEGFLFPFIDRGRCVNCGVCQRVCPVLNPMSQRGTIECYAARSLDDDILRCSSSGGIFTELAQVVLRVGGCVYGCVFTEGDLRACHVRVERIEQLALMRKSKYVQSDIGQSFREARSDLLEGRYVLFSGTPCQIAGLKMFLGKEYDNLLLVSVLCKGVPSPAVFERYKHDLERAHSAALTGVYLRTKVKSWRFWGGAYFFDNGDKNFCMDKRQDPYIRSFLDGYCSRRSCRQCAFRTGRSGADIVIGDFWGVEKYRPDLDDDRGISCVLIYTEKGQRLFSKLGIDKTVVSYAEVISKNHVEEETVGSKYRWLFMHLFKMIGITKTRKIVLSCEKVERVVRRVCRRIW